VARSARVRLLATLYTFFWWKSSPQLEHLPLPFEAGPERPRPDRFHPL